MLRQRGAQVYQRYCFQAQPASARRIATDATITVMRTKGRGRYVRVLIPLDVAHDSGMISPTVPI